MWQVKLSLERKKIPSFTRRCRPNFERNLYARYLSRLKGYRFGNQLLFIIWAGLMHLILRILKSLEQTQESNNFKISFEIFVKMLDGSNFGKRCLLECSIWNFFQN
jgi:hypothetical protein